MDCFDDQQQLATRAQLIAAGIGRGRLQRAVTSGAVVRVHRGIYALRPLEPPSRHLVSGGRPDPRYVARVRAALLALGPEAYAVGRTAAVLRGWDMAVEPARVEVAVPVGAWVPRIAGVDLVRTRDPRSEPVVVLAGTVALRVELVVQTVVRLSRRLPPAEAVVVLDSAFRCGAVTVAEVRHAAVRTRGPAALRRVLALADPASGSVLESLLRVLLRRAGLPAPLSQYVLPGTRQRVDFAWPARRLVVEADGRRWHDPDDARQHDRRRDNTAARLGWRVLRFTWGEVVHEPDAVVAAVRDALRLAA